MDTQKKKPDPVYFIFIKCTSFGREVAHAAMHAVLGQSWVISEERELLADPVGIRVVLESCFCGRLVESLNLIFNYKAKTRRLSLQQGRVSRITRSPIRPAKQTVTGSRRNVAVMACAGTKPASHHSCEPVVLGRK